MRLRWKLEPRETGLSAVCAGPRSSYLHDGKEKFAAVQAMCRRARDSATWFWWARNDNHGVPLFNSCGTPVATVDEAKAQAMAYVLDQLQKRASAQKGTND